MTKRKVSTLVLALLPLVLMSFLQLDTSCSPISDLEESSAPYGHPSMATWQNSTPVGRQIGMDLFNKFLRSPFPYGFIEFLRGGTAFLNRQGTLPSRLTSFVKHQWNRVAMPQPISPVDLTSGDVRYE